MVSLRSAVGTAVRFVGRSEVLRAAVARGDDFGEWASRFDTVRSAVIARPDSIVETHLRNRLGYTDPAMSVDASVSDEQLANMFDHVAGTWSSLGASEPYWSVISQDQFRTSERPSRDEFYSLGESNRHELVATLQRNGFELTGDQVCLELGCGVGRATWLIAEEFATVHAVDVSAPHLALAREWCEQRNVTNVGFVQLVAIEDLTELPMVDVVYSMIVLQHNPPPVMAALLSSVLGCLNPGGVAVVQIPTYDHRYRFDADRYPASSGEGIEMHVLPQHAVFSTVADADCRVLEVFEDSWTGLAPKTVSNTFVIQRPS